MKKLLILLTMLLTLNAACLGDKEAQILNLGGNYGIDSVKIYQNNAYVSLDFGS